MNKPYNMIPNEDFMMDIKKNISKTCVKFLRIYIKWFIGLDFG